MVVSGRVACGTESDARMLSPVLKIRERGMNGARTTS